MDPWGIFQALDQLLPLQLTGTVIISAQKFKNLSVHMATSSYQTQHIMHTDMYTISWQIGLEISNNITLHFAFPKKLPDSLLCKLVTNLCFFVSFV